MNKTNLDLYTDYLLSTYGAATATGFPSSTLPTHFSSLGPSRLVMNQ